MMADASAVGAVPWSVVDPWPQGSHGCTAEDGSQNPNHESLAQPSLITTAAADAASEYSESFPATAQPSQPPLVPEPVVKSPLGDIDREASWSFELYRIHSVAFELSEGDTLVFIDYPSPPKDAKRRADCHGIAYDSQQFRVHAEKLLATGSSKFAEMLNPTYQFRVQRRRKMVNKLPDGVKYLLDLTPPSEGDDLVFQMTELSLTPGIMGWWLANKMHGADSWSVTGHDDICSCQRAVPNHQRRKENPNNQVTNIAEIPFVEQFNYEETPPEEEIKTENTAAKPTGLPKTLPPTADVLQRLRDMGINKIYETPPYRQIPDYCPFRHRNSIIRLLMVIEGQNIILDSASRVWTMVALGKIFDCPMVVRDRVAQWIMHVQNTSFIEVLPEEALQIGFTLELPQVTQAAFRILVNELALTEAATDQAHRRTQTTIFGRRIGDPGDELSNLIQHAARALVDRLSANIDELRNPDILDFWNDVPEWNRLRAIENVLLQDKDYPEVQHALDMLRRLMSAITFTITSKFDEVAEADPSRDGKSYIGVDNDRAQYVEPKNFVPTRDILRSMNLVQRLLCSFFYDELTIKWDADLYTTDKRSTHPLSNGRTFVALCQKVEDAMQQAIIENPALEESEGWQPYIQKRPQGVFKGSSSRVKVPIIGLWPLDEQIKSAVRPFTLSWIRRDIEPPLNMTRHLLLTLQFNELKYLPLWAGGCNDGTGGVFEDFLPPAEMGANGPGPAYHTGLTVPSTTSSLSGSLMDEITAMKIKGSTAAGSVDVQDSISTVYRPDHVIADSDSIASETFTAGASDYADAQFAVPAEHQRMGQAVDMLVESATDNESTTTDTETIVTDQETTTEGDSVVGVPVRTPTSSHGDNDSEDSMVIV